MKRRDPASVRKDSHGKWILLDYIDFVISLFTNHPAFYDLSASARPIRGIPTNEKLNCLERGSKRRRYLQRSCRLDLSAPVHGREKFPGGRRFPPFCAECSSGSFFCLHSVPTCGSPTPIGQERITLVERACCPLLLCAAGPSRLPGSFRKDSPLQIRRNLQSGNPG